MRECTQSRHHDAGRQDTRLHQSSRTRTCRRNQPISATIRPCVQVEACGPITVTHNHGGMVPQQRKTGHITREATTKRCLASLPEFEHLDGRPRGVSTGVEFVNVKAKVPVMSHSISSAIRLPQTGGERRLREARHTRTATRAVKLKRTHSIGSSYVSG